MPTWYTRQSSAEIVTDQVIEASDFNNEFNAISSAFTNVSSYVVAIDANLSSAIAYVSTYAAGILGSFTVAMSGTFGVGHGHTGTYGQGPLIVLTGTAGVTGVTGALAPQFGGTQLSTSDPAVTDDTPDYVRGSKWVNTSSGDVFVCTDNSTGAAVWVPIGADQGQGALYAGVFGV